MRTPNTKPNLQSGQAMLLAVLFFLAITTTVVLGTATPILKQVKISNETQRSKASYYLTEGAMEDALYRVKNAKNISSGETIVVNGYTSTINITTITNGKIIETITDRDGIIRKMQSQVTAGTGVAFNYGIQVGQGGFEMSGSSGVNGNVYSNGDILGTGSTFITGSATAANASALISDQVNNSPTTPTQSMVFGNVNATQDVAQSFQIPITAQVNKVKFYIKKTGSPANATVRIVTNSGTSPSTTVLDTATLNASLVTTNYGWVELNFVSNAELNAATTYWLVIDASNGTANTYTIAANTAYTSGQAKIGRYSSTWSATTPSGLDMYFDLYTGGIPSTIGGGTYVGALRVGTGSVGDTWAANVTGTQANGALYCQTGSNNNKACNTSRAAPSAIDFPISDGNIEDWKDEAAAGGVHSGNYTLGGSSVATIGPKHITGNLTVEGSGVLTVSGTLWVDGAVTIGGSGKLKLASSYGSNSGVVVSGGKMNISGSGAISGSGQAGSYVLFVTESDCPIGPVCTTGDAITVSGSAGAVVLNAQKGSINFGGSAAAKEATAYKIIMSGSATVTYESGIADMTFSSGPSGGWNINTWKEVQ